MNRTGNIQMLTKRLLSSIKKREDINITDYRMFMLLKAHETIDVYYRDLMATGEKCEILKKMCLEFYKYSKLPEKEIYKITRNLWKSENKSEVLF